MYHCSLIFNHLEGEQMDEIMKVMNGPLKAKQFTERGDISDLLYIVSKGKSEFTVCLNQKKNN